jgi:NAD-dependent SIR2 family protein deacetylase
VPRGHCLSGLRRDPQVRHDQLRAAGLVEVAASRGARVVIVNAEPTPYDGLADLVVREPISEVLPHLFGIRG